MRPLAAGVAATIVIALAGATLARTPPPLVADYTRAMVGPLPASLPYDRTFYRKFVDAHGIPVISSAKVPDAALLMARDIVVYMLAGRPDLRQEMIAKGYRVGVMAQTEMTTDIPEQRDRKKPAKDDPRLTRTEREHYDKPGGMGSLTDKQYWDRRARGLGVVLVVEAERPGEPQMAQQPAGDAAILADDVIGRGQHPLGPARQVGQVADRRRHEVEARVQFTAGIGRASLDVLCGRR